MVKDIQKNLYHFIISFSKENKSTQVTAKNEIDTSCKRTPPPGGGVLTYMGYIGMCGPKGYGFSAVLVINRASSLADFGHFGHKQDMVSVL